MTKYHNLNSNFVCNKNTTFNKVLFLIKATKGFPIVVINDDKSLFGVISNGDISNLIRKNNSIDKNLILAKDIANQNPKVAHILDKYETIEGYLSNKNPKIRTIPIIDFNRIVKKVATSENPSLTIGKYEIGDGYKPFLIAEIGVNHNGLLTEAKFLIKKAAESGCSAVKFQHRSNNLYNKKEIDTYDLGTQYIISEIDRTRLSINELKECAEFAAQNRLEVIVTPFDEEALKEIIQKEIPLSAIKIASCDLTNEPLIRSCCKYNLPIIISTGMSFEREISETSLLMQSLMVEHAFLHCNSTYPAPPEDINLSYIKRLKDITKTVVGYSSHDGNFEIPIFSIGYGAHILEFHITRSINSKGTDHRASIEVKELKKFVDTCKIAFKVQGKSIPRFPSQGEITNRNALGKSFALKKKYLKGQTILKDDLILISPGHGFNIDKIDQLIGKKILVNKDPESLILPDEIEEKLRFSKITLKQSIKNLISKGYITGIPVRYHDVKKLRDIFDVPLLEFHMSDRDLKLNPENFIDQTFKEIKLVVHAVEQFEDGFIFDLCSEDNNTIRKSFSAINDLVVHIQKLRVFFKPSSKVPVVLNLGGFTNNNFVDEDKYRKKLDLGVKNLNKLIDLYQDCQFLPQTMPPFPWHQGGRSFHNLLTNKKRLEDFLNLTDANICFDVSHSFMSCEFFKEDLIDHLKILSSRIEHIHLSDASSANSEGLEIGEGFIDFLNLNKEIMKKNKNILMIPEIWQGHLNNGEKFANSIIRFNEIIKN